MAKTTAPVKNSLVIPPTPTPTPTSSREPTEDEVRDYAYHLFQQGNSAPGHDVENWLEATACLKANIPPHESHRRLHQHVSTSGNAQLLPATV